MSSHRRRNLCLSVAKSVWQCDTTISTMVKFFMSSLNFARSLKKVQSNPFCVLLALVNLASFGVYLSAVINERPCYWPKYINGSNIDAHFDFKEVGLTDSLPGTLEGTEFKSFAWRRRKAMWWNWWQPTERYNQLMKERHNLVSHIKMGFKKMWASNTGSPSSTTSKFATRWMTTTIIDTPHQSLWKRVSTQKTVRSGC